MATELTGRVVLPGDPAYDKARENLNLYQSKFPGAIVFCQEEKDVLHALTFAREKGLPFRVRSGRHSYQNFSNLDGGLVIDISEMNEISVSVPTKTAKVCAGADLGKVYNTLWKYGLALPGGTEFSVGVSGVTLGGGIGYLSREFGLTCDHVERMRIVVPKGEKGAEIIEATKDENSDLFWACCGGGGGNFGIVTSFTFRTHPIDNVSVFKIDWEFDQLEDVFETWQNWAPFTDHKLTSTLELHAKSKNLIRSEGQFLGSKKRLIELIKPLLKDNKPRKVQVGSLPFNKAFNYFNEPSGNKPSFFKRSGSFVYKPIPERGISIMKRFLEHAPNEDAVIWQQSLGGAVSDVPPSDTAFFHRDAKIAQEYNTTWTNEEEARDNVQWVVALRKQMRRYTEGDYVNWPDETIRDWQQAYYGENVHRLRKIKTEVDPLNVFRFQQSVPPY
ncbi:FAD-binding oxidoreductase [Alkalihalobacillus sp. CinArs1]|uniref:FAD-binding oxidoreductase n=1 Tax=Alkalihalobacillus sp. CinArs1 TaxID=2995314 RepID=UPI0022DD066C|nr:FAD-binding oxidoreductase [Alkalihalobacillus sp. CinArs1]